MRDDLEADIAETEQRHEEIMKSSLQEDHILEADVSDLSSASPVEAVPGEELKVGPYPGYASLNFENLQLSGIEHTYKPSFTQKLCKKCPNVFELSSVQGSRNLSLSLNFLHIKG